MFIGLWGFRRLSEVTRLFSSRVPGAGKGGEETPRVQPGRQAGSVPPRSAATSGPTGWGRGTEHNTGLPCVGSCQVGGVMGPLHPTLPELWVKMTLGVHVLMGTCRGSSLSRCLT